MSENQRFITGENLRRLLEVWNNRGYDIKRKDINGGFKLVVSDTSGHTKYTLAFYDKTQKGVLFMAEKAMQERRERQEYASALKEIFKAVIWVVVIISSGYAALQLVDLF